MKSRLTGSPLKRKNVWGKGYFIYMTSSLKNRLAALALLTLMVMAICVTVVWQVDYRLTLVRQEKSFQQLNSALEQILIARFTKTADALAKTDAVIALLQGRLSDKDREVELTLNTSRLITGADMVYVLDRNSIMTGSAGMNKKDEYMFKPFAFRPYFKAGMQGKSMLYAAVGAYSGERGIYFTSPVIDPEVKKPSGVVVIKAGLEEVDRLFLSQHENVLLISPDGVVFSTNRPEWLFHTCHQLGKEAIERIYQEKQFPENFVVKPLPVNLYGDVKDVYLEGVHFNVHKEETVIPGWQLVALNRHVFPFTEVIFSGGMVLLLSFVIALYLISLERKRTLQHNYDIQSLDLDHMRRGLVRSEALLQSVVEDQTELICRFDGDRRVTFVNGAFCRYFGRERDELMGTVFQLPLLEGDRESVQKLIGELTPDNPVGAIEYGLLMPRNEVHWHAATIRKIFGEDGRVSEYQTVLRDITNRKRYEEALKEANTELSQYAYVVSHDLRAPLRAIRNYADFLREDLEASLEGDQKLYLDRLDRAVRDAEMLIEDVLAFSRVSHCSLRLEKVELGHFFKTLVSSLDLPPDVTVVTPEDWPVIEAEPVLLKQIFQNLIVNAAKYNTSSQKLVELGWSALGDDGYLFFVRDNGIGIGARYHEQIFRVFERLHTREEYEGTGAGLAIVKKAAARLHGTVRVESAPGKGSTFYVALPENQKELTV